jgi:hypothetical protein
MPNAQ